MMSTDFTSPSSSKGLCRKDLYPQRYAKEKAWFLDRFERPKDVHPPIDTQDIKLYQELIWENPPDLFMEKYGCTVDQMSEFCGQEKNVCLSPCHIKWLLQKTNAKSSDSLCLCLPTMTVSQVEESMKSKLSISTFVFVINVGTKEDGSIFIAPPQHPGSHWVLVTADLESRCLFYCDSFGWNAPTSLRDTLSTYTEKLKLPSLKHSKIIFMHYPSSGKKRHSCTKLCRLFPFLSQYNITGIVSVAFAIVVALDADFFYIFVRIHPSTKERPFLQFPRRYEKHLRQILISFFIKEEVDNSVLKERHISFETDLVGDHAYCMGKTSLKRIVIEECIKQYVEKEKVVVKEKVNEKEKERLNEKVKEKMKEKETAVVKSQPCKQMKKTELSPPSRNKIQCPYCSMLLSGRRSLWTHKKRRHKSEMPPNPVKASGTSHCTMCSDFKTSVVKDMIAHYCRKHHQKINIFTKRFSSELEFKTWKKKIEMDSSSRFTSSSGADKRTGTYSRTRFYCHRSGHRKSVSQRKRSVKSQGSCKMGNLCTAFMVVKVKTADGSVTVEYCLQHTGHSFEPGHLRISAEMRSNIAGKLCQGLDIAEILDDIKSRTIDVNNRDSLISRKDIRNIKHQYGIVYSEKHTFDSQSLHLWVQEFEKQADNPVILFKAQSMAHDVLGVQDFLLCLQTDFQRYMFLTYAPRIVCVDMTRTTTGNNILLMTILVLGENDQEIPVGWAFSNGDGKEILQLQLFLTALKDSCQKDIDTKILMSAPPGDDVYSAWCHVFPKPQKRFYSLWHVYKDWRETIESSVTSKTVQSLTYNLLKELQMERDETRFREMLQDFLSYLTMNAPAFSDYFDKNYIQHDKFLLWGQSFCVEDCVDKFADAVGKILQDFNSELNENKGVGNLLFVLLNNARERAIDQLLKSHKEKFSYYMSEIRERHNASIGVVDITKCQTGDKWNVPVTANSSQTFTVKKALDKQCECKFVCDLCHVCIHTFTCTCHDFLLQPITCKHIHAVQTLLNDRNMNGGEEEAIHVETEIIIRIDENKEMSTVQAGFANEISKLLDIGLRCQDVDRLKTMQARIKDIIVVDTERNEESGIGENQE